MAIEKNKEGIDAIKLAVVQLPTCLRIWLSRSQNRVGFPYNGFQLFRRG